MAKMNIVLRDSAGNTRAGYRVQIKDTLSQITADTIDGSIVDNDDGTYVTLDDIAAGVYTVYASSTLSGTPAVVSGYESVGVASEVSGTIAITSGGTGATSAAVARTNLGLIIGDDIMGYEAALDGATAEVVGLPEGYSKAFFAHDETDGIQARTTSEVRTDLGLVIGTNVQAWNSDLDAVVSGGAPGRAVLGLGDVATESVVPVAKGGTGATAKATARANLDLTVGTHVQQHSEILDDVVAIPATHFGHDAFVVADASLGVVGKTVAETQTILELGTAAYEDKTATGEALKIPIFNSDKTLNFPIVSGNTGTIPATSPNFGKIYFRTYGNEEAGTFGLYYIGRRSTGNPLAAYTYHEETIVEKTWV